MKEKRSAQCTGWMAAVFTLLLGACTHNFRGSDEPRVTSKAIAEVVADAGILQTQPLTFQARSVFTYKAGNQESFTLLGQLKPIEKKVDLWLISDFGASVFHGSTTLGEETKIRRNQTSLSDARIEQLLLIPWAYALYLSCMDEETRHAHPTLPFPSGDQQGQPQHFMLESGSSWVRLAHSGCMNNPENQVTFPSFIQITGSSRDPAITISLISISAS